MNCDHHSSNYETDNELICTGCSPDRTGGKRVNKTKAPLKSTIPVFCDGKLLTVSPVQHGSGEQVLLAELTKKPPLGRL
jgi:hypothetical protein